MVKGKKRTRATARPPEVNLARKTRTTDAGLPEEIAAFIDTELLGYLENAYLQEPLTRKGILKRSHDAVERWLDIISEDARVIEAFEEFETRTDLRNRLIDMLKNSMIYGVGYLEVVIEGDDTAPDEPLPSGRIEELALVSPKLLAPVWDKETGHVAYFAHYKPGLNETVHVHPSRIIMLPYDTIRDGHRFVGVIEPMLHVVAAKIELDKASGQIPKKVVSQIIAVNIANGTRKEVTEWLNALEKLKEAGRFVASDRVNFQFHEAAKALDIKPYSEHLIYQIAGGVGVPYTVLLGAGAGTISTSETNLRDYYSDLKDIQTRLTPLIRAVFNLELKALGMDGADYTVEWREIFADEQSEADVLARKAAAIEKLISVGIITTDEARDILGLPPLEAVEAEESAQFGTKVRSGWYARH